MKVAVDTQRNGAIGVICADRERQVVMEFFECFKTAWEFYRKDELYDVVITTGEVYVKPSKINSKVLLVYGSEEGDLDRRENFPAGPRETGAGIDYNGTFVPIYGSVLTFGTAAQPFMRSSSGGTAGFRVDRGEKTVVRIGYDLFREVEILLTAGQPVGFASVPTLDVHISVLRNCILDSGIPVLEIPPVPVGHDCIACLTHDVDFLRVTDHGLDHTILGFLYRATIGSILGFVKGQIPWTRLIQNWKAALSLPVVHAGLCSDFWFEDFGRYFDIEKDLGSTFFFIPFKNSPGDKVEVRHSRRRAATYDVRDAAELIGTLEQQGFEIGVHGIDAWHSREGAAKERARISDVAPASTGIRMHWLCFGENSWQILDEVGFQYDSTFGYNDAIGYRAGTTQVFRPLG